MFFGIAQVKKSRDAIVGIQTDMEFDSAFSLAEFSPEESNKTELNNRGVEELQFSLEPEAMSWGDCLAFLQQNPEDFLIEAGALFFIDSGER